MTVSTTTNKIIYPGNGSTTAFPFTFAVPSSGDADIEVFFTDTSGNITQLTEGPGSTQYQLTINPVSGTNPTPAGGMVNYNPSGIPIPLNTSLTILRSLPMVQGTSLANQGTLYQPVEEAALDYQTMLSQQIQEEIGRALQVAVSDPTPTNLPAVAARAGLFLAFDSSGNPIASQPSGANTAISSAMVPVVTAASTALAQTAMGLGNVAATNAGIGLAIGGGQLNVLSQVVADTTNKSVDFSFHHEIRAATGALTYTLPQASTQSDGFGFTVLALTAAVTFAINAGDKFSGGSTGVSMVIPPGSQAFVTTDGGTTWYLILTNAVGALDPARNLQINATVSSNALTIALKDRNGNDPSTASPVVLAFRDSTLTNGDPVIRALTGPLSITVPSGASLGTQNGTAGRIWIGLFDNAGTLVLGVYNSCQIVTGIPVSVVSWDESNPASGTAISAGATSAQTWYTSGSITTKSLRIIGYLEASEATAGTWATGPTLVQLYGPGMRKPGDVVHELYGTNSTSDSFTSASYVVFGHSQITITPASAANLIRVDASGNMGFTPAGVADVQLSRGNTNNSGLIGSVAHGTSVSATGNPGYPLSLFAYDITNTTSPIVYAVQGRVTSSTISYPGSGTSVMSAKEIFV